jgi:hypothetical protein
MKTLLIVPATLIALSVPALAGDDVPGRNSPNQQDAQAATVTLDAFEVAGDRYDDVPGDRNPRSGKAVDGGSDSLA